MAQSLYRHVHSRSNTFGAGYVAADFNFGSDRRMEYVALAFKQSESSKRLLLSAWEPAYFCKIIEIKKFTN